MILNIILICFLSSLVLIPLILTLDEILFDYFERRRIIKRRQYEKEIGIYYED